MSALRTIYLTELDVKRLREVIRDAASTEYRGSPYIDNLRSEMERAVVVAPQDVPADVITMNSRMLVEDTRTGEEMTITLVYPEEADVLQDKISVLAPIGTALLGYRVGDEVEWEVPEGISRLKVKQILYQPEASGDLNL